MKKRALITGITGQDGSYLAELLLHHGYEVHGLVRRAALEDPFYRFWRLRNIKHRIILHPGEISNFSNVFNVVKTCLPDEIYHLAAQSFVKESFDDPFTTMDMNVNGTLNVLESMRAMKYNIKMYFAGSSEMFGKVVEVPQKETTPFYPRSPYGVSKVAGFDLVRNYRESYDMFCCSGILFNHESPRRGMEFVTRKITREAAKISMGISNEIRLGNIIATRDWGHSKDYVRAMHLMLQEKEPDDYVIATGKIHSVKEFAEKAFAYFNLDVDKYLKIDPSFERPADVILLRGDYTKAYEKFAWSPEITFDQLIEDMCANDAALLTNDVFRRGI